MKRWLGVQLGPDPGNRARSLARFAFQTPNPPRAPLLCKYTRATHKHTSVSFLHVRAHGRVQRPRGRLPRGGGRVVVWGRWWRRKREHREKRLWGRSSGLSEGVCLSSLVSLIWRQSGSDQRYRFQFVRLPPLPGSFYGEGGGYSIAILFLFDWLTRVEIFMVENSIEIEY